MAGHLLPLNDNSHKIIAHTGIRSRRHDGGFLPNYCYIRVAFAWKAEISRLRAGYPHVGFQFDRLNFKVNPVEAEMKIIRPRNASLPNRARRHCQFIVGNLEAHYRCRSNPSNSPCACSASIVDIAGESGPKRAMVTHLQALMDESNIATARGGAEWTR